MSIRAFAAVLISLGTLTACSGWYGGGEEPPLPGDRVSVLLRESRLSADPNVADLKVSLPAVAANGAWPQHGGSPTDRPQHPAGPKEPSLAWRAELGENAAGAGQLLARPVVADGSIYGMDAFGSISAFDAKTGALRWRRTNEDLALDDSVFGGGLAYHQGGLYAVLTTGTVIGLDGKSGEEIWRQTLTLPLRSAPAVADGIVLVLTADNQVYALEQDTGQPAWRHAGFFEASGVLGGPSPAVDGGIAVVPYSSAEVFALRLDNGRPLWSDTLQRPRRTLGLAEINDIDGAPVIDGDRVYVGGRGGQIAAIDIRRGVRAWDADLAAIDTPWIAGDFLFLLTERGEVACLLRKNGRIRWIEPMPSTTDPDDEGADALTWRGPVLAGGRLYLTSSGGDLMTLSPYDGKQISRLKLPAPAAAAPVIADGAVFILTENAELIAYR
ncbi:MAG: PQQ-like beta-propeller repeat protein [Alphaproteobacteria bacterium]|nr:PQQ-like beta-propeller repeat protein [Alphaproteobacteria bacterium]